MSILIISVLNSVPDRLAISSSLNCISFWNFDLFFHLSHISLSQCSSYIVRGRALGICRGRANQLLYYSPVCGGGVQEETMPIAQLSASFQHFPSITQKQIGPLWWWFPGAWVCVHSRTLWTSPTNSPVSLGFLPMSHPKGFYIQWFWGFISPH